MSNLYKPVDKASPWRELVIIVQKLFNQSDKYKDGVSFSYYENGGTWKYEFGGIKMSIKCADFSFKRRGVKLDKNGMLDLDKVLVKFEELKKLHLEEEQKREDKALHDNTIKDEMKYLKGLLNAKFNGYDIDVSRGAMSYKVSFYASKEEILAFINEK